MPYTALTICGARNVMLAVTLITQFSIVARFHQLSESLSLPFFKSNPAAAVITQNWFTNVRKVGVSVITPR